MEQHELIRRMVYVDGLSQREVARQLGHSRKTVAKALKTAAPTGYQRKKPVARRKLDSFKSIVTQWLTEDRVRHRKQRHTAVRIYERLRDEHGYNGSRRAVSDLVKQLRSMLEGRDVFVPIEHQAGHEVQIDWGEADVILNGKTTRVMLFCARLAYSKATFVHAYVRADQPSFLDGHVRLIDYLGGVPRQFAYDNLKSAVTKVVGRQRSLNKKFTELRSHYLFQTRFCSVARGNEKGHTENSVKRAQRNYLTPLPSVTSIAQLNRHLLQCCTEDLSRTDKATGSTYGQLLEKERELFLQSPVTPFRACVQRAARVNHHATVQFDGARYSVPTRFVGMHSIIRVGIDWVEVIVENQVVARHDRQGEGQWALSLEHYLPLLQRKPGLLDSGKPFVKSQFTDAELLLRKELEYRYHDDGTRQFLNILLLCKEFDFGLVRQAIENCVAARAFHEEAVRLEINQLEQTSRNAPAPMLELQSRPELDNVSCGHCDLAAYDALMSDSEQPTCDSSTEIHSPPESRSHDKNDQESNLDESNLDESNHDESNHDESNEQSYEQEVNEQDNVQEGRRQANEENCKTTIVGAPNGARRRPKATTIANLCNGILFALSGMFA